MRDVFIRGIFGVCEQCSTELSLRSDVQRIIKFGHGFTYQGRCPSCSAVNQTVVDRSTHVDGVAYMKQVAANKAAADRIFEPVNDAEAELYDFGHFLEEATTDTIWMELLASS